MSSIEKIAAQAYGDNTDRGFYDDIDSDNVRDLLSMIMLGVTEDAELVEALRRPEPQMSEKIPEFTEEEEEWADAILRRLDYGAFRGLRIAEVLEAKMKYNRTRGHRHGGKRA